MKLDTIVPYKCDWRVGTISLREALNLMPEQKHATSKELEETLTSPAAVIEYLLQDANQAYSPTLLFCGSKYLFQERTEYVMALRLHALRRLVAEKYWLDELLLPSCTFATLT